MGVSQSGDFLGHISGIDIDGICSEQPNMKLIAKSEVEQISLGITDKIGFPFLFPRITKFSIF